MEKLLYGETQPQNETSTNVKTDIFTVNKSEELEVKMNEAKQMVRYLSSDVKSAIEDYKSPFTRVKVQLNPQKLGEVELTIVQRGNNLHVNISSNNAAINTLALNANELRTTLTNNGINNATLNFNNTSDNSSFSQQQQNRQNEKQAHKEYNYYEKEEVKEEILSSLEIIVPRYI
jgi:flagellar hook-length control protein FliK